jgi:hypothetical protein
MKKPNFKSSYSEKLKDPRWQKKRLEILNRDDWTCQICGAKDRPLHAHHPQYNSEINNPWEYDNQQIITLCESCHSIEHECLHGVKEYLLISIVNAGFNTSEKIGMLSDMIDTMSMGRYADNPCKDKELFLSMVESYWENGTI